MDRGRGGGRLAPLPGRGRRHPWLQGEAPSGPTNGRRMSPGGFKPFEHQWAMAEAFELHERIGRRRIEERTHRLARRLKEGLAGCAT